jgi:diaminohydroxyphosphoribosylaminopyrimidine deaminase/5-amino-6-(5-phosphoribosylamino)uracil reductase
MQTPDPSFMRRAIALSRKGFPAPNPHVGCVIVREGRIVAEGYHDFAGGPHAERVALAAAGAEAEGGDVYVTLEPCNHTGRTPPCVDALVEARVRRVVIASTDPNPVAAGGAGALRQCGISVVEGVLQREAEAANRQFLFALDQRRPYVVVKAAASIDGRTALPTGESKWITGPAATREGWKLRAECGAVLVGYRTVQADDPELTARIPTVRNQPLRVVLDPHGNLLGTERVFNDGAETLLVTGQILLSDLLARLYARSVTGLLVEGGARTIGAFFKEGLVDRVELLMGPKLLGSGPSWAEGLTTPDLASAPNLRIERVRRLGPDLQITATPIWNGH